MFLRAQDKLMHVYGVRPQSWLVQLRRDTVGQQTRFREYLSWKPSVPSRYTL